MIKEPPDNLLQFKQKAWTVVVIGAFVVVLLWIIKVTFNVLLLILAGALIALYFHGLSGLIHRKLHIAKKWSLLLAVVISFLLLTLFFAFAGNKVGQQIDELTKTLPATIDNVKQYLNNSSIGRQIIQRVSSEDNMQKMSLLIKSFFRSTFGVLGDMYVVLFLGLFFTASPTPYLSGFLKLMPSSAKPGAEHILNLVGFRLTKWLKGKLLAMLVVAILTLVGLLIIGMPMAFALALIAGLLNFIPNFGPLIALIPAVLVGFTQGPVTAALVAGLYILVQVLESNFITPQIQKRLISIPPALIIIAQLMMGVLTGGWGLIVATPLILILMTVIGELYVKKQDK
ncbi:AI-2E family transporter [Niastella populi]|uniref:AI-2E family transporter n=1 Tax=Niastella populi TaxID=550983 RepID=A0A1V9FER7_9BACT|nr:AI-2E family transporter [Niastella populi]OQP56716.1 AI-2E family transporter [Niastella populi]